MAGRATKIIRLLLLVAIGGVFAVAGGMKVIDPAAFATDIDHYHLLPWPLIAGLALYLPWLECLCAAALLFEKFRASGLRLMLGMSFVFLAAMSSAAARGLDISCGCFGSGAGGGHLGLAIARDVGMIAAIAWCLSAEKNARDTGIPGL